MKNFFGAFSAGQFSLETLVGGRPGTNYVSNPGGGGGGGGHSPPAQGPAVHPRPSGGEARLLWLPRGTERPQPPAMSIGPLASAPDDGPAPARVRRGHGGGGHEAPGGGAGLS